MIHALRERHLLPMVTPAAILGCIGRIHFDEGSPSFFRFGGQTRKELRPRGIGNALGKTMVMNHTVDMQVLDTDGAEAINNLAAFLMREVVSSERNAFMHTSDSAAVLL